VGERLKRQIVTTLVALAALFASGRCTTAAPAPKAEPRAEDRYLVDPRIGYPKPPSPAGARRFEAAWQSFLAGDLPRAHTQFAEIVQKESYPPALLGDAAIDLREGRLDQAEAKIVRAETEVTNYTAARIYQAEVELARNRTRAAYDIYRSVVTNGSAPESARARVVELERQLFDDVYQRAIAAPDEQAIVLLREALAIAPSSEPARLLLVQKEIAQKSYDDAQRDVEPLLNGANPDQPELHEALAEIDAGRGRYHEAITRYERLARRSPDPRYTRRLDELKDRWNAANMPPVYQRALESFSVTRADLAVLMYWQIPSIRFAQSVGAPPIAVDVDVPGRDEIIRAMALGIYQVDAVTRRVNPGGIVNAQALNRIAARVLITRGAPCVRNAASDPTEGGRVLKVLVACGITPASELADSAVSGREARDLLDRVSTVLSSTEKGQPR
jgi:tetratricopeptide (TPR) repeat protein